MSNLIHLTLFLTGLMLGCLVSRSTRLSVDLSIADDWLVRFCDYSLIYGKFLLLIYLLSFMRYGAIGVPPLFGLEGIMIGCKITSAFCFGGVHDLLAVLVLNVFHIVLILPYGFVLGAWTVDRCFDYTVKQYSKNPMVLMVTLCVIVVSALLQSVAGSALLRIMYNSGV